MSKTHCRDCVDVNEVSENEKEENKPAQDGNF